MAQMTRILYLVAALKMKAKIKGHTDMMSEEKGPRADYINTFPYESPAPEPSICHTDYNVTQIAQITRIYIWVVLSSSKLKQKY